MKREDLRSMVALSSSTVNRENQFIFSVKFSGSSHSPAYPRQPFYP